MYRCSTARVTIAVLALVACSKGTSEGPNGKAVGEPATTFGHIHGLGVDGSGTLYVATHGGLIKSIGDERWAYASGDRNDHMGFSIQPAAGMMYRSGHSSARPSLGVERSKDGAGWEHLSDVADPPVDFHAMTVSYADASTLWGWDSGRRGTFRSADGGKTWQILALQGIENFIYVLSGTAQAGVVLAGTVTGLYRSIDGGTVWKPVSGVGGGFAIAIAGDPRNGERILVFTQRGMKQTVDGGATWSDAGTGLPSGAEITSLVISPVDPAVAYAADAATIYKTKDSGKSWIVIHSAR